MAEKIFTVTNEAGIHARPATLLVHKAGQYGSELTIDFNGRKANLKSIMGVMSMGIRQNTRIKVIAEGPDEEEAIAGITEIFKSEGLGEPES
ncbi:phosphocarrier protein HPr [Sporolactobacillus sp. THM7-7]|nr:phosphocarrier protein HPr [Sporolactobacillus sp. THM7-7]